MAFLPISLNDCPKIPAFDYLNPPNVMPSPQIPVHKWYFSPAPPKPAEEPQDEEARPATLFGFSALFGH